MPSGPYPTSLAKGHLRSLSKANAAASESEKAGSSTENLVAIKLISQSHIKKNDRMRISIVREVEVLKVRDTVPVTVIRHKLTITLL